MKVTECSARVFAQAQAMEELGESSENIEIEARKAEKALNSVGVSIRDAHDPSSLRNLEDILGDLAKKWDTLSDATKNYVAEGVAGTNRRNYFITTMQNYGRVLELTNAGLESQGELTKANETRVQSLEGQINILTDKLLSFMDSFQPVIHGSVQLGITVVDALQSITNFVSTNFIPIMGAATGAVVAFEIASKGLITTKIKEFFMDGISTIAKFTTSTVTATGALSTMTVGALALKVALGGIVGGVVVAGIYAIAKALKSTHKSTEELTQSLEKTSSSLSTLQDNNNKIANLSTQYKNLSSSLKYLDEGSKVYKDTEEKLLEVQHEIASIYPTLTTYIDEEGKMYATSQQAVEDYAQAQKELYEIKKEAQRLEAESNYNSVEKSLETAKQDREQAILDLKSYAEEVARLQSKVNAKGYEEGSIKMLADSDFALLEKYKSLYDETVSAIDKYDEEIARSGTLLANYNVILGKTTQTQEQFKDSTEQAKNSSAILADAFGAINQEIDSMKPQNIENATESYVELANKARDIQSIIDEISKNGIHLDALDSASEYMAGFTGNIGNAEDVLKHLNEVLQATNEETYLLYANLLSYDKSYWESANANSIEYFNNNIKNTNEWANFQQQIYNQLMKIDAIMNENKVANYDGYFSHVAKNMQTELANCKSLAEAKVKIETVATEAIMKQHREVANAMKSYGGYYDMKGDWVETSEYHEFDNYNGISTAQANQAISSILKWKQNALASIQSIDALINTAPTFTSAIGNMSDSLSSASKEAEKLVADLEEIADAYYEINNALKDVENALDQNRTEQGYAAPQRLVQLLKEEVELLERKQDLLLENRRQAESEAQSIKTYLQSQGFDFKGEDIENYSEKFASLRQWANSLKGDEKESAIEYVEALMEQVERYTELVKDEIPNITNEWMDMTNQIREAEKEMAQVVTDAQKDISSAIENALNKRYNLIKKELEKEKALFEQQYEEEDYEDSLNAENRKLDEIRQQISDLSRDTSLAGQLKLQQLRAEYEAQQKVIDDMIRDHEREQGSNRFDEEMDKLDEELDELLSPENIAQLVNQALVDGFVTIGDEVVQLNTLMTDWLNETGDGLLAIGDYLREELISNLQVAQELLAGMGITPAQNSSKGRSVEMPQESYDYSSQAMDNVARNMPKTHTQPIQEINLGSLLNVEGNITDDVLPKVESMLNRAKTEIFNNISKQLSRR